MYEYNVVGSSLGLDAGPMTSDPHLSCGPMHIFFSKNENVEITKCILCAHNNKYIFSTQINDKMEEN